MNIYLNDFLLHAHLGNIHPGLSRVTVQNILGDPDDVSRDNNIIKYNGIQIGFTDNIITFIGIYTAKGKLFLPEHTHIKPDITNFIIRPEFIKNYIRENYIQHKTNNLLTFENQECLTTGKGVQVLFDLGEDILHSFQFSS